MHWHVVIAVLAVLWFRENEARHLVHRLDYVTPNCTLLGEWANVTRNVYRGWPFAITCSTFEMIEFQNFTCTIWDMDRKSVLLNKTDFLDDYVYFAYENYDARDDSPLNFYLQATINNCMQTTEPPYCWYSEVHINLTNAPVETCEQSLLTSNAAVQEVYLGNSINLDCSVPSSHPSPLSPVPSDMTFTWLRNCSMLEEQAANSSMLHIQSFSYDDPGLYTCRVSYNGLVRYVIHQPACVLPPTSYNTAPSVHCNHNKIEISIGQTITLECILDPGTSIASFVYIRWTQKRNYQITEGTLCYQHSEGTFQSPNTPKVLCAYKLNKKCILHNASQEERQVEPPNIILRLIIPDVQLSDLGTYTIEVRTVRTIYSYVSVLKKPQEGWIIGVGVGLASLLIILLVVVLCYCFRLHIFVFIRRFSKMYTTEQKSYGAYLSYQLSTEMDTFSQQQTRDAVSFIRNTLNCLGYTTYDEIRDRQAGENIAKSSIESMAKCHRVVIILTSEYIKDSWNVYKLQQGFLNMIESGSKMIFIVVAGAQEFINQRSFDDDCCKMINRAILLNHAIKWSNGKKFNEKRFKFQLELAMPNINPHATNLPPGMANGNGRGNGYQRGISNDTDVTL